MNHTNKYLFLLLSVIILISCKDKNTQTLIIQRPNVLFISIDDLNDWIEPLGGHPQAKTPNLMSFSQKAVNFEHAYCASPGCNPSRGAILTGLHTYTSGLYSNYQDWRLIDIMKKGPTLNRYFKDNGYYTAGAGKIYHYQQTDPDGWENYFPSKLNPMPQEYLPEKRPLNMPRYKYMYGMFDWGPVDIPEAEMGDYKSVSFIKEQMKKDHQGKPFFLACGIYRPHVPWYVPKKYFDMFPLEDIKLPEVKIGDLDDIGTFAKEEIVERGGNYNKQVMAANQDKKAVQGYLASMAYADAMFGELLEGLRESGKEDNTIIVIWSDHGWQLGEKDHWRKFALWENVTRSVLMIKAPQIATKLPMGSQAGKVKSLASLLDIYPTLVDLCGLPPRDSLDGVSLLPFINNPNLEIERPVITTYDYGSYSVRFKQWHYIRYIDNSKELYDLNLDPEEWNNLASKEEQSELIQKLDDYIPKNPVDLPITSLIELQEHHIAPIQSEAHYQSTERKEWMKRFKSPKAANQ